MKTGLIASKCVETCLISTTILQVAELMRTEHVGDLVVVEYRQGNRYPVGIITDRDLAIAVMAMQLDPESVKVKDIMSRELVLVSDRDELEVTLEKMREASVRRVPLVNAQQVLVGIVTIDDIVEYLSDRLLQASQLGILQSANEREQRR